LSPQHIIGKFLIRYSKSFKLKWIVLLIDVLITFVMYPLSHIIRINFMISEVDLASMLKESLAVTTIYTLVYLGGDSFAGIVRQTGLRDARLVIRATTWSIGFLIITTSLNQSFMNGSLYIMARSTLIIHYLLTSFALLFFRFMFKVFYTNFLNTDRIWKNVLIFGAGDMGKILRHTLERNTASGIRVIAFIDDNPYLQKKSVEGTPVFNLMETLTAEFVSKYKVAELYIAVENISPLRRKTVAEKCLALGVGLKSVPPASQWVRGELTVKQLQRLRIEDLLQRNPIELEQNHVRSLLENQTVLVTGGAGSIGSEIARQVALCNPNKLILVDEAESALYDLQQSFIRQQIPSSERIEYVICDVTRAERMEEIFAKYQPDMVYHAAAYKHVPLMESNAVEAVHTNIIGTSIVARLSEKYGVKRMVMVSTDKAINPTNIMGATKRFAEMYCTAMQQKAEGKTQFITTRFGNVLGSNGSVIPLFQRQIRAGGPVTVTHPEVSRFFMTIPEACNLVLEASATGKGGEIFVFDMGERVKIVDLAKKMIQLSGLEPDRDIPITFSGLRPGEKLHEELLATGEDLLETHHPKILISKVRPVNPTEIDAVLNDLLEKTQQSLSAEEWSSVIRVVVPEYQPELGG